MQNMVLLVHSAMIFAVGTATIGFIILCVAMKIDTLLND